MRWERRPFIRQSFPTLTPTSPPNRSLRGPTKAELKQFFDDQSGFINDEQVMWWSDFHSAARAVLTRYGHQRPTPIPLAERQPTEADGDKEGECWWWHPDHKEDDFGDGWMLLSPKWADGSHDSDGSPIHTHWLPHWALPVPEEQP